MKRLNILFLFIAVVGAAQSFDETILLKDMVFNASEKEQSLDIMYEVAKNVKNNYQFYQKVNYPITVEYDGNACSETYTGEISYNKLMNSSYILDGIDNESCMIKDLGNIYPLTYILSSNIRWLDNWGGAFSRKRLKKAKYGKLLTLDESYLISTYGKGNLEENGLEIEINRKTMRFYVWKEIFSMIL